MKFLYLRILFIVLDVFLLSLKEPSISEIWENR